MRRKEFVNNLHFLPRTHLLIPLCNCLHGTTQGEEKLKPLFLPPPARSTSRISCCGLEVAEDNHPPKAGTQARPIALLPQPVTALFLGP